jgi:hypothetical protein
MKRKLTPDLQTGSGFTAGTVAGILTYLLVTFVPAWHSGLPADVSNVLPMAAGVIFYYITSLTVHKKVAAREARQYGAQFDRRHENPAADLPYVQ